MSSGPTSDRQKLGEYWLSFHPDNRNRFPEHAGCGGGKRDESAKTLCMRCRGDVIRAPQVMFLIQ